MYTQDSGKENSRKLRVACSRVTNYWHGGVSKRVGQVMKTVSNEFKDPVFTEARLFYLHFNK